MRQQKIILPVFAVMLIFNALKSDAAEQLSDNWKDYQIQIDGQIYEFPMMFEDFAALGWITEEADGFELEPNQTGTLSFTMDDRKCTGYLVNHGVNVEPAVNCIVGGIGMDGFDWALDDGEVLLPGQIRRGEATVGNIENAYGTPSDLYDGELYEKLTYETDSYCYMELSVYKESGVLEDIAIRNYVEPAGFDPGSPSDEIPEEIFAYDRPEELSSDLTEFQIALNSAVYAMPVPVRMLMEDGWKLNPDNSDFIVKAGYFGWAALEKDGLEIHTIVVNNARYATSPENCWIEELQTGGFSLDAEGTLAGGIHTGMTETELKDLLDHAGISYQIDDRSEDFTYYTYNKEAYNRFCEVTVYKNEDEYFKKDTVIEVDCSYAFE